MSRLEIYLFGTPQLLVDAEPVTLLRRKALALLAYLAVTGQRHSREALAEFLWPDNDSAQSRAALRRALATINETVLSKWIAADRDTIVLKTGNDVWIDVAQFNVLLAQQSIPESLEQAASLYRDSFMAGFTLKDSAAFDNWQASQTQHFQQKLFAAFDRLAHHYIESGQPEQAITALRRWLDFDPFHEKAQRQLIETYATSGQRSSALAQYDTYRALLNEELGIQPDTEIQQLIERIKTESIRPSTLRLVIGSLPPLPVLVVGREDALHEVKRRLHVNGSQATPERPQVVIQGWPGIGKTTLTSVIAHESDVQQRYRDGILWTSLGQHPNLLSVLTNWGRSLGFHELERAQHVDEASARMTAFLKDRQTLLILDDVWTVDHAVPLRVGGPNSGLLITTRLNDAARALAERPEAIYKIPILSQQESLALLRALAPQVIEQYPREAASLAVDLEGLPLALQVAGRLLQAEIGMGWGIGDLLAELRSGSRLLEAQAPADRSELAAETTPTIAALLRRSVERLPAEMQLKFALLGVFAPKPATFSVAALGAVWDTEDVRPAIRTLVDRGLLEPAQSGHFQMHALLVMLAKSMFEELH